jgi:hypothetical protein
MGQNPPFDPERDTENGRNTPDKIFSVGSLTMSALPLKADMCGATRHVRFVPIADI